MHLNLTLSAPGGPGSSWGDRENPKPLGAQGRGALPLPRRLRFAAAFRGPRRESPLGRRSQGFWKLVEWDRREMGPGCPGRDSKAITLVRCLLWFSRHLLPQRSEMLRMRGRHTSGSALSPGPSSPASRDPPNENGWLVSRRGKF